jgi:hypothetical protein
MAGPWPSVCYSLRMGFQSSISIPLSDTSLVVDVEKTQSPVDFAAMANSKNKNGKGFVPNVANGTVIPDTVTP